MKLLSFEYKETRSFGLINDSGIVDLGKRYQHLKDLREVLRSGKLEKIIKETRGIDSDFSIEEIKFLPTIPNPEKIICIGVNYANRNAEYKDGSEPPKYPSVFTRSRESLVGHHQYILDPP